MQICVSYEVNISVYAAQPREGTETLNLTNLNLLHDKVVYAAQPREGTETRARSPRYLHIWRVVYAAQPREGTET